MAAEPLESLTLFDLSDPELLEIVLDETSTESGYAATKEIAKAIGITGKRANQCVGGRLAWLRRKKAVTLGGPQKWAVTQIGQDLISGKLKTPQRNAVANASDAEVMLLATELAARTREAPLTAGWIVNRQWKRGVA